VKWSSGYTLFTLVNNLLKCLHSNGLALSRPTSNSFVVFAILIFVQPSASRINLSNYITYFPDPGRGTGYCFSSDINGDVTMVFVIYGFLLVHLVVNFNQPPFSHSSWNIKVTTLTFWGHVTSSVTWLLNSQYGVTYRWSIWSDRLSRSVFEILSFKDIGVTTLTFRGHMTSSVMWPLDSQCAVSYW